MSLFEYTGRSENGEKIQGRIEAVSTGNVAAELASRGIVPIRIEAAVRPDESRNVDIDRWWHRRRISLVDVIMLCRQMTTLVRAGVPITKSLRGLSETMRNPELGRVLDEVAGELEKGHGLAGVLQRYPDIFSNLFVAVVHIGESSGRLEESFEQLHGYLALEDDTRKRIKSAFRYPTIVIVSMVVALVVINLFVVPPFAKLFAGFGVDLPWATRILISTSDVMNRYWHIGLSLTVFFTIVFRRWITTPEGRYAWQRAQLQIPKIGGILHRALLARFCRTLAITLGAGLPVTQCLSIASRAVDNDFVGRQVIQMREDIESGDTLAGAAQTAGMFTPLVMQMLAVGEETGAVEETLTEVADYYEREVDYELKTISSAIEPIMMIFVGALVLVLALGVYLPMWEMASSTRV